MDSDDDDPTINNYNDGNRAFLQAIMARGTVTFKQARPILAAIFSIQENKKIEPEDVTEADFDSYISAATAALSPFDYEIRSTTHQVTKERIFAIVNSTSDALTQLATIRSADEVAYIKRVLDAMFETHNTLRAEAMAVTSMQALKVIKGDRRASADAGGSSSAGTGLTSSQGERLLGSLVDEGWFERSIDGWYSLSARALLELQGWLVATYNEPDAGEDEWQRIKFCEACKGLVTVGQRCVTLQCNVRLHDVCQAAFWRTRREKKCPKCEAEWDGRHWVGERVITTSEQYLRGKRRSGNTNGVRRSETVVEDEPDEEEAGEEQERQGEAILEDGEEEEEGGEDVDEEEEEAEEDEEEE